MNEPLVSIITPVYNGAAYLDQCIASVRSQTYANWRYLILDNCSTDGSADIARTHAALDSRISVITNDRFLPLIENHNAAISRIDADAVYCKPLMADDWLFPDCIEKMVAVSSASPTIGLVCCYATDGANVLWDGLPLQSMPIPGREVCRMRLLGGPYVFGSPSSMMIRADLVRSRQPFYNPANTHADVESCFEVLKTESFGFAYQVLVFNRIHEESVTASVSGLLSVQAGTFSIFCKFGRIFLEPEEFRTHLDFRLRRYYGMLAKAAFGRPGKEFWAHHRRILEQCGHPFRKLTLIMAMAREFISIMLDQHRLITRIRYRSRSTSKRGLN